MLHVAGDIAVLGSREGLDHIIQNLIDTRSSTGNDTPTRDRRAIARRVRLAVTDRAPGFPEGNEERIFERFYRLDAGRSRNRAAAASAWRSSRAERSDRWARLGRHAAPGARFVSSSMRLDRAR